ncbi:hypothetical protein [Aurantimonas sp. HBX-1]|uniref:hypothetical protein n=1 Tax=Aurantimonas sp. HBX-1 TaxID=2906072 RepID=UPI001F15A0B2|nr:hypothetical protein [Aurantimonas sp. HBX-1]UIJ71065.1 hypothetical protein LXB15_15230 [Aurantimonas sp. HBX-1]
MELFTVGIFSAITAYILFYNPVFQQFIFSSDQLTVPSITEDLLRNENFSIFSWMLPRAPYIFPDLMSYTAFRILTDDIYTAVICMLVFHCGLIALAGRLMLNRIVPDRVGADNAWGIFLLFCIILVTTSFFDNLPALEGASILFNIFVPIAHGSAAVCAVFGFIFYEKISYRKTGILDVIFVMFCSIAIFSDKLFVVFFAAPYALANYLASPVTERIKRLGRFLGTISLSIVTALLIEELFTMQYFEPLRLRLLEKSSMMIGLIIDSPVTFSLFLVGCAAAFYLFVQAALEIWNANEVRNAASLRAKLFVAFLTLGGLAFGILLWENDALAYARYMVGMQLGGALALAALVAGWMKQSRRTLFALGGAAAVLSALPLLSVHARGTVGPSAEWARIAGQLNSCRERYALENGYAEYWLARKLSVITDWTIDINQFAPWSPDPFFWGNNILWYYYDMDSGHLGKSNFIISNGLQKNEITNRYGEPSNEVPCAEFNIMIYDDWRQLQRRVNEKLPTANSDEEILEHFPDDFSPVDIALGDYSPTSFQRQVGVVDNGELEAKSPRDPAGFLMYGPYVDLPAGSYEVQVEFVCTNMGEGSFFDVTANIGQISLNRSVFARNDDRCNGAENSVSMPFILEKDTTNIEFRAHFGGTGDMAVKSVRVDRSS